MRRRCWVLNCQHVSNLRHGKTMFPLAFRILVTHYSSLEISQYGSRPVAVLSIFFYNWPLQKHLPSHKIIIQFI